MVRRYAEQQVVVAATPHECFETLIDYESFPSWQRAVKGVEVVSRDQAGRGEEVLIEVDAEVGTVSYRLVYTYEPPHRISWKYADSHVKEVDGELILEDRGDGTTLATYSVAIEPGGAWVPGRVLTILDERLMRGSLDDLKRRLERSRSARDGDGAGD